MPTQSFLPLPRQTIGCETCDNHTQHTNGQSLCPLPPPPPPPGPAPQCTLTEGRNLQGGDLLCKGTGSACPLPAKAAADCCELCGSKPAYAEPKGVCSAWTWSAGKCYLKGSTSGNVAGRGMVSGVVSSRGPPHPLPRLNKSPMEPTITAPGACPRNRFWLPQPAKCGRRC